MDTGTKILTYVDSISHYEIFPKEIEEPNNPCFTSDYLLPLFLLFNFFNHSIY